jgi:hypothetical protein
MAAELASRAVNSKDKTPLTPILLIFSNTKERFSDSHLFKQLILKKLPSSGPV